MATSAGTLGRIDKFPSFSCQDGELEEWAFRAMSVLTMMHEDADDGIAAAGVLTTSFRRGP